MSDADGRLRGPTGGETRRLAVLLLCVLALIVAAFAFPGSMAAPANGNGGGGNGGTGGQGGAGTDGGGQPGGDVDGPPGRVPDAPGSDGDSGGGEVVIDPGGDGTGERVSEEEAARMDVPGCLVVLGREPTPGASVPVFVVRDGELAADVLVRFNGDPIGRTDASGTVVGRVPYTRDLSVSVEMAGVDDCRFETPSSLRESDAVAAAIPGGWSPLGAGVPFASSAQSDPSGTVSVDGSVAVGVHGEAFPGESVTVVAAVDGVPMRDAMVRVDGDVVGRTGEDGALALEVPADGRERLTVVVERGEFSGSTTVNVATLSVGLGSESVLPLPGDEATARVTIGGDPVAGAPVRVDGRVVGHTDARGRISFAAPADPTVTVRTRYRGLTASAGIWLLYLPLVVALFLAVGTVAGVTWRYGRRRGLQASAGVAGVAVAWVAYRLYGGRGLAVALVALAIAGLAAWAAANRRQVAEGAGEAGGVLSGFVEWLATMALRAVAGIERLLARASGLAERIGAWIAGTPRSVRGVVGAVVGVVLRFLRSIPGRLVAAARAIGRSPWTLLSWLRSRREDADGEDDQPLDPAPEGGSAIPTTGDDASEPEPISLREAWRRFARHVAARDWRRRTPGEIARAAVDQGLPRESVLVLTNVFRDVEYGDRPPSEDRIERARKAFRRLDGTEGGEREASD